MEDSVPQGVATSLSIRLKLLGSLARRWTAFVGLATVRLKPASTAHEARSFEGGAVIASFELLLLVSFAQSSVLCSVLRVTR